MHRSSPSGIPSVGAWRSWGREEDRAVKSLLQPFPSTGASARFSVEPPLDTSARSGEEANRTPTRNCSLWLPPQPLPAAGSISCVTPTGPQAGSFSPAPQTLIPTALVPSQVSVAFEWKIHPGRGYRSWLSQGGVCVWGHAGNSRCQNPS